MFELTYRCNFHCKHCYVPQSYRRKKGELKTKEVFFILDQLKDIGCFYLGFTGGEPFLREDIMEILLYAKKKGLELIIYTNGSLIEERIAEELADLRPNKIDITIPAMSKAAFERISGVAGSRDKVFKTIELLRKNGVNLGFKTCVLKENESEIGEIQNFAESLGALHRLDDTLSPRLDGSKEPYQYRGRLFNKANLRKSNANYRECLNENISVNSRVPNEVTQRSLSLRSRKDTEDIATFGTISENSRLFKCGVGRSQAAITPSGKLKLCLMIDYPKNKVLNIEDRSRKTENGKQRENLKEAWERLKELVASIKPNKDYQCDRCELEPYCKWCPARGWLYNGSFSSCDPQSRARAELIRKNWDASM